MDGPSFPSPSSSDELNNCIDCSDEDFPISDPSFILHDMYSSSERVTPQSVALEIKNSMLDSLLTEKQKNINIYKSSSIYPPSHIQRYKPMHQGLCPWRVKCLCSFTFFSNTRVNRGRQLSSHSLIQVPFRCL